MPIKLIVAHNLAELRKSRGLTQGELAEKFDYTDKSISKWEHGDTLPDIEVLKQLCDFYGVTLDYLVTENKEEQKRMLAKESHAANKWIIVALSVSCAWLVAILAFFIGQVLLKARWSQVGWIMFMYAVPVSCIIMLVFNGVWGRPLWRTILAISLTWSALACVYLTLGLFLPEEAGWGLWHIFLIGIPLTVAAILWNLMVTTRRKKR